MAEKINIIVTEKALTDLNTAIEQVKKLEGFINKASTPSTNANFSDEIKKQADNTKILSDRLLMIASLNKQRYQEEAKLIADNDKALTYKSEKELKQIRDKQAMIASLNKQKEQERKETEKTLLSNQKLNDAYGKLTRQREEASRALRNSIIETGNASAATRKLQKEFDVLNKKVAAADKAVRRFSNANRQINVLSRTVGNLMTAFGVSTGLYLFASIAKDIYQVTKQLQSLDLALKMVSGSQEEFANNQSFLTNLAEQYGIEIKGLTKNFTEFWVASKGKLEAEQIKAIFTSISKSVAVMGLSVEQQDSAFLALQQMMSKGTVQAEELKKQLGNALPGAVKAATMAYQALHPELKVTEKYFMEQMKAGKVLSAELLPELAKAYEKLYGIENVKRAETLQAAQERLKNSWTDLVRSMNESKTGGISTFFKTIIDGATSAMESIGWLNDDWDKLLEKAMGEGRAKGDVAFEKAFMKNVNVKSKDGKLIPFNEIGKDGGKDFLENAKGQLTEEQIILKVLNESRKKHIELKAEELKLRIEWQRLVDEGNDPVGTKRKLERLYKEIGTIETVIGIARERAGLDKARERAGLDKASPKPTTNGTTDTKAQIEADAKAKEKKLKAIEESAKLDYDLALSNANRKKEIIEDELNAFRGSIEEKIQLSYKLALAENKINKIKLKEDKRLSKGDGRLIGIAENEEFKAQGDSIQNNLKRIGGYWKEYFKELDTLPDTLFGDKYKLTPEQKEALEQYNNKIKSELKATMETFKMFVGDFADRLGFTDTFDFLLNPDKEGNTLFDRLKKDEDHWRDYGLAITTVMQDAYNFINQQSQARFQAERERLESQKETALKNTGDSAAAKEKIEADYEKKKKEIERREAKAKKQQALFNIAIDTAQAVMAVSAKAQWWMIPAMIAMGAIQAGMVASQKIPEYWRGTKNAEEGLALTNERGAEIHTDKKGNIKDFGSNKGARLTKMSAGDVVYTAEETRRMMFENEYHGLLRINGIGNAKPSSGMTATEMKGIMVETLGGRPTLNMNFDKGGFGTYISKNGNITRESELRGLGRGIEI